MKMINSINETAKLCKEQNVGISRNHIRHLANSGIIPCVKIGNKVLVNWDGLMTYLTTNHLAPPEETPKIRKISA
jgi:excisionase family DNA binding protein